MSTRSARLRILDAAEQLFAERGFDRTATSRIAELARVPKGLLFYYFPAKTDILRALVSERLDFDPVDPGSLVVPGDPVLSLLRLSAKVDEIQEGSHVLRVIVSREQHTHPEVRAGLLAHRRRLLGLVERVLAASVAVPVASASLREAAQLWLAVLTTHPLAEGGEEASGDGLPGLARFLCRGLSPA